MTGQSVSYDVEEAAECCPDVKEIGDRADDEEVHDEQVQEKARCGLQFSGMTKFIECSSTWQYYE